MIGTWRSRRREDGLRPSRRPRLPTGKKTAPARSKKSLRPSKSSGDGGTARTTPLHTDWSEVLRTLSQHGVRYLLIGGHAVSVHSSPRYTEDLDILVEPTRANGLRLHRARRVRSR